ncbi:MAG: hypothetical protein KJ721_00280 [Nanoarchaeota archaeon]|nr:hypothetical protein [Nanoarchaeota archaeon]
MTKIEYKGLRYKITEVELTQLKEDSNKPKGTKLQEGWESVIDITIKVWDNLGKELTLYVAKKLVDKILKDKKPEN